MLSAIFVGTGGRAGSHLNAWIADPRVEIVGLVDTNAELLKLAGERANVSAKRQFSNLEAALAAVDANVVVVATPARSHVGFIRLALSAGKHVMVEKPFTCELAEAEELVEQAETLGLKIMVTQQIRYLRIERTIQRLLRERALGELGFGHYVHYKSRGSAYPASDHMHLWQQAVHELDALLAMIDRPVERVCAREFQPPWGDWPSESTISAVLEFEGGPTISYLSTSDSRVWGQEFRLECEQGAVVQRGTRVGGSDATLELVTAAGRETPPLDDGIENRDSTRAMADLFVKYVVDDEEPEVTGKKNLETMRLCDAVIRSSLTGSPVVLGSTAG